MLEDDVMQGYAGPIPLEHARLFETWMELRRRPASFWRPKDCGLTYGEGKWAVKGSTDEPHWVHFYSPETNFRFTGFAFDDDHDDTVWIWPPHEQPESPMCHKPILAKWKDCVIAYELLSWSAFLNLCETRMDYEDEAL
jgi:hypothetical protein